MGLLNKKQEKFRPAKERFEPSVETLDDIEKDKARERLKPREREEVIDKELDSSAVLPASQTIPQDEPIKLKTERLQQIERILEADLGDFYFDLDKEHKQIFKAAGEQTARQINKLLNQAKIQAQKIFELIKSWLRLIPGINKWFVMQESKIKTDKILRIKNKN